MKEFFIEYRYNTKCKIIIQRGLMNKAAEIIKGEILSPAYFLFTVPPVKKIYYELIKKTFKNEGMKILLKVIKDGEKSKSQKIVDEIIRFLSKHQAHRDTVIIAMGGGVIGDVVGYCASIYMRGISYIQIPTSLIAQIDSSIGGKTAINTDFGKNLIGTFYQPLLVLIDPDFIKTLPSQEFINGLGEVIKYGILDREIFFFLEENAEKIKIKDPDVLLEIIEKCCNYKIQIVQKDLYDKNLRALLNLGHTIGHALESITNYKYFKHGEAIALGILASSYISFKRNILKKESFNKIIDLCYIFKVIKKLPNFSFKELIKIMRIDKKQSSMFFTFLLPEEIGKVNLYSDIKISEIEAAIEFICEIHKHLN